MTDFVQEYIVVFSDGTELPQRFSEAQATAHGAALYDQGILLPAAVRIIQAWNKRAEHQGNSLRYRL